MGRMWELPQTSLEAHGRDDLVSELRERHGLDVEPGALVVRARHAITFRRIQVEAYRARLRREPPPDSDRFRWAGPDDLPALPMSSLSRKVLAGLERAQMPLDLEGTS